jgi:hypothetical protein
VTVGSKYSTVHGSAATLRSSASSVAEYQREVGRPIAADEFCGEVRVCEC